nr:UDP-N-acetyl-alpha-D-glucosamine C6 dehydratase [uncultured bacterium]
MTFRTLKGMLRALSAQAGRAIDRLPRWVFNRSGLNIIDACVSLVATWLAWQLRFDFAVSNNYRAAMSVSALVLMVVRPACLWLMGAYRIIWRYFNLGDAITFGLAAAPPTFLMFVLRIAWIHSHPKAILPFTVIVLDYGIFLLVGIGLRALRRYLFEASLGVSPSSESKRTILMGTAEGLASALRQISFHPEIHIVRLLSSDMKLHGSRLAGFRVSDGFQSLSKHLASEQIDLVLVADSDSESIANAVGTAVEYGVDTCLMPMAAQIIRGEVRVSSNPKPELALKKLVPIARQPHEKVISAFRERTVLITGAGGSIGSELSRQVAHLPVERLVLLDQDENSIFRISEELGSGVRAEVVPYVADIRDTERISSIFAQQQPNIVLHAAAYKHVPIMEYNCSEAILNNVVGTRNTVEAAIECRAERFLMISTDKAVNPSSVMGATKRMAELVVQHLALSQTTDEGAFTRCACVRFGNVMGSSGSVVPTFLQQIAAGGPVTITHEEMTRYFMTISSAVQLVLQATTLGSNGEIYLLDMGDPVKITSLANRLIEMSGLRPGQDIEIRIVGTRPGEKLHEQLWSDSTCVSATCFPSVLRVEPSPPPLKFEYDLALLESVALTRNDARARAALIEMPISFGEMWEQASA